MPRIAMIDPETAAPEVKKVIAEHLAQGYRLTNEKLTLLHNPVAFDALEATSYRLDRELQRLIGQQAADFFEYAISLENDCAVCSTYFANLLKKRGISFEDFAFSPREQLLIDYGRAMAKDPKHVSDVLFARMKAEFTDEEIIVITAMGYFMLANNYFNDWMQVDPSPYVSPAAETGKKG